MVRRRQVRRSPTGWSARSASPSWLGPWSRKSMSCAYGAAPGTEQLQRVHQQVAGRPEQRGHPRAIDQHRLVPGRRGPGVGGLTPDARRRVPGVGPSTSSAAGPALAQRSSRSSCPARCWPPVTTSTSALRHDHRGASVNGGVGPASPSRCGRCAGGSARSVVTSRRRRCRRAASSPAGRPGTGAQARCRRVGRADARVDQRDPVPSSYRIAKLRKRNSQLAVRGPRGRVERRPRAAHCAAVAFGNASARGSEERPCGVVQGEDGERSERCGSRP